VTVFVNRVLPEVTHLTAVSGRNKVALHWSNPRDHDGVLIVRATAGAPTAQPVPGTRYEPGAVLGNGVVVYGDAQSFSSSFTDSGLTNGARYHYRVFNHDEYFLYSSGNEPAIGGLFSEPTARTLPQPLWCYTVGFPSLQQPVTELGTAVFTASNAGAVTANLTAPTNEPIDGSERWRPTRLAGAVQSRFVVVPLEGKTGRYILTGDQAGYAYAIHAQTGAISWRGNGGLPVGDHIQAQAAVQLHAFANTAYRAAHPGRDLVFFATRNDNRTNNRVVALSGQTGEAVWAYAPGDLDIVSGGMLVDYDRNRLWVAGRSGETKSQASVRVLSSLDGSLVAQFFVGDVDLPVNRDFGAPADPLDDMAYVATVAGEVMGFDLITPGTEPKWRMAVGPMTAYPFPLGHGFIASLKSGVLQRFDVDLANQRAVAIWPSAPAVPGPSGVRLEYTEQVLYVGDKDGFLHQIRLEDGARTGLLRLSTGPVGTPTVDDTVSPKRLHVGTFDGRLCGLQVPF
jgi:hypothetical protein